MFTITLESKDGQRYQMSSEKETEADAVHEAKEHIEKLGWDYHQYKLVRCERTLPKENK